MITPDQDRVLKSIEKWLATDSREFLLGGYAGTGKTFVIQEFVNNCKQLVICCAPTGKAASVLAAKLEHVPVITIHSLLYTPVHQHLGTLQQLMQELRDKPNDKELKQQIQEEKERLSKQDVQFSSKTENGIAKDQLIIVDEASMVSPKMREDLLASGARVIYVGDPAQLPPVRHAGWLIQGKLDAYLDVVVRQAKNSPIIRLSQDIRAGSVNARNYKTDECMIIGSNNLSDDHLLMADQVITGRNKTRYMYNRLIRSLNKRHGEIPNKGEKLICLKNENYDGVLYINGVMCCATSDIDYNKLDIMYDGCNIKGVFVYLHRFLKNYCEDLSEDPYYIRKQFREFDYGYVLTVHKAQGSEWDKVLIIDDKMQLDNQQFRKQWLYTAVTRASKSLVLCCG